MIARIIKFASIAHDKQLRKGTNIPYIAHPFSVGMNLLKYGYPEYVVGAGILHDIIEDTEFTYDDLKKEFGVEVANLVLSCTEPDKALSWEQRKEHTIEFLDIASDYAKAIICADKIDNVKGILERYANEGESLWNSFKRGKEAQKWYYTTINSILYNNQKDGIFYEYNELIKKLQKI